MDDVHPMQYVEDVTAGRIVVCEWVRLAVERHLHDLKHCHERGLWFDEEAAWRVIIFCQVCKHYKGEFAGQPFQPEPWQLFFLWVLFGWMRDDGTRRFRTAYLEIARKNGKTYLGAVIGLYLTYADGEAGAEVYTVATKRDQARLCHGDAVQIVKNSSPLRKIFTVLRDNLSVDMFAAKFEPVGRDSDSLDGLNVSGAIMDELHAWKNRDLWNVIDTATGARQQPLIVAITTAGFNRQTVCWDQHVHLKKILSGLVVDDTYFGMIFSLDDEAELENDQAWVKANPNLGVSVKLNDLRHKVEQAKSMPAQMNAILRLRFNIWTQAEKRWIHPDKWATCGKVVVREEDLVGRSCYGGLDLSSTTDISSLVLVFPPIEEDEPYKVLCRFWIPEECITERSRRDRVPYDVFLREELVTGTPGNVIDYSWIIKQISDDAEKFELQEIAFDRWGATKVIQDIEEMNLQVVQFGQGFASMSPPMKELEKLVISNKLAHGGNKVLAWMADNVVAVQDPAGNIKPDKSKSIEKIDGIVALVMGLDRALHEETPMKKSVYEERGLRAV